MTDNQEKGIVAAIVIGVGSLLAWDIYNNVTTQNQIMNTPATPGATGATGNGITVGAIPTAAGGVNNAMDIRDFGIPWQGRIPVANGAMAQFEYMWQSYRAAIKTLWSHFSNGQNTLNLFFAGDPSKGTNADGSMVSPGYAPAGDSNTPGIYANNVAAEMGITADTDLTNYIRSIPALTAMLTAMATEEQGSTFVVNQNDINMALANLGIS